MNSEEISEFSRDFLTIEILKITYFTSTRCKATPISVVTRRK